MDIKKELGFRASEAEKIIYQYLPAKAEYQKTIIEAVNYSLMAGGKRLRPILMQETHRLFGGNSKAIEPFMAAMEMIHTYSLVHDDLPAMDNDMLRRGKPTTHAVYGEAMGILAGDALLNYSMETALKAFDTENADYNNIVRALKLLYTSAGIYGMVGGQVVDVESEKTCGISREQIDYIYDNKTGALIKAAMCIGAILAGANDEEIAIIDSVAYNIGLAFQIQDDILDIEGSEEELGKPIGSDERNEKVTYVTFAGMERAKSEVERLTEEAVSKLNTLPYTNEFLVELLKYLVYRTN